ncbi:hypothetical protein [Endozoicomonas ascidiicola]|uniref:hypothetical protein n=1 Tax=Endozoicomonas ascidiicola TaxID=1698521 RepID=UPI0008315A1E|nr:hypothetical protein [Endozoicomonas ascidiicola]
MSPVRQSLYFFSRYGVSITAVFCLTALFSTVLSYLLTGQIHSDEALSSGSIELLISSLIEPLATGTVICFIASRDRGNMLSLMDTFAQARSLYLPLVSSYMLVLLATLVGMGLYILPGLFLLYKLMFVEYRVVLNGEQPLDAIKGSFVQTKGEIRLLLPVFVLLLVLLFGFQAVTSFLIQGSDLASQILKAVLNTPVQAFSVIVGFRLFILTEKSA